MQPYDLTIGGMTCAHCVRAITAALAAVPGLVVDEVTVGRARVQLAAGPDEAAATLSAAIERAGYTLAAITPAVPA